MPYSQLGDMIIISTPWVVTNYQALTVLGDWHALGIWPCKEQALTFIADAFAGVPPPPPLPHPTSGIDL